MLNVEVDFVSNPRSFGCLSRLRAEERGNGNDNESKGNTTEHG